MTEQKPLPKIAISAFAQFQQQVAQAQNELVTQTFDAMGLAATDGWKIDLAIGAAIREVTESKPELVQPS